MIWIQLVTLLAVLQFFVFGGLVGRARGLYGVKAPATTGHDVFERYYRVQMNTLENLVVFLPAMWLAAQYWSPLWMAALGAIYLLGRVLYLLGYVADPGKRAIGFGLSMMPTVILLAAAFIGALRALTF